MLLSGLIVLAFVIFHLLHFTLGAVDGEYLEYRDGENRHDIYRMVVQGFSHPAVSLFYLLSMALLCLHLSHGAASFLHSLGLSSGRCRAWASRLALGLAWTIFLGNSSSRWRCSWATAVHEAGRGHSARPLEGKWDRHRFALRLVNPANRRRHRVLVVGSGLAGASAAASLGEMGYQVRCFCYQDSPRRAHSIAAQGGSTPPRTTATTGTACGGSSTTRSRGGTSAPARPTSTGWPRSLLDHRPVRGAGGPLRPGVRGGCWPTAPSAGPQVSRTFYARGQTGQQLLLGAYQALCRQVERGAVEMLPRTEMQDLVVEEGRARGIVVRDLVTGEIRSHAGDAVVLATGATLRSSTSRPTRWDAT